MNKIHRLLLVEDDADWLDLYCEYIKSDEYDLTTARTIPQAFALLEHQDFDVVVTDLKMTGYEYGGFGVLEKVKEINTSTQVIVITAYGTDEIAVKTMQQGAYSIIYKPPEPERFRIMIRGAAQAKSVLAEKKKANITPVQIEASGTSLQQQPTMSLFGILGNSRMMRRAFEKISYAANVDQSVFIYGEKGTGKSFIARTIHANSMRKNRPFGQMEFSLLSPRWESAQKNIQKFSGGTILVDNILSIGWDEGRLLENLHDQAHRNNVRLISALTSTVSDLDQIQIGAGWSTSMVEKLMPISVFVPPLRFRRDGDDIPALIGNYIRTAPGNHPKSGQIVVSPKAMEMFLALDYADENIVELYGTLNRSLSLIGPDNEILEEHVWIRDGPETHPNSIQDDKPKLVFISYATDDSAIVDQLQKELETHNIQIWRDKDKIFPGMRWKTEIQRAVENGALFIACFSAASQARSKTYFYEELNLAVDELRLRPRDRAWFIPVKLNQCSIPDWRIGGGESLNDIQYLELFTDWKKGIDALVRVIKSTEQKR